MGHGDADAATRSARTARRLTVRQTIYLRVLYQTDQDAETEQRRRWRQGIRRDPAEQWRWMPYATDHPRAGPTDIQQHLAQAGKHDAASGATLAALIRRGLIEMRTVEIDTPHGRARQRQLRLTRAGRRMAREYQPADNPQAAPSLPSWLHDTLVTVRDAPPPGLVKTEISRRAARALGPAGHRYIDDTHPWAYTLTPEGTDYLTNVTHAPAAPQP